MNPQPSVLETGALPVELLPSVHRHDAHGLPSERTVPQGYRMGRVPSHAEVTAAGRRGQFGHKRRSAGLLVERMATVPRAEFLHLDAFAVVHLVFRGDVVAPLTGLAGQSDLDSLVVSCHGDSLVPLAAPATGPLYVLLGYCGTAVLLSFITSGSILDPGHVLLRPTVRRRPFARLPWHSGELVAAAGLEPATPRL